MDLYNYVHVHVDGHLHSVLAEIEGYQEGAYPRPCEREGLGTRLGVSLR